MTLRVQPETLLAFFMLQLVFLVSGNCDPLANLKGRAPKEENGNAPSDVTLDAAEGYLLPYACAKKGCERVCKKMVAKFNGFLPGDGQLLKDRGNYLLYPFEQLKKDSSLKMKQIRKSALNAGEVKRFSSLFDVILDYRLVIETAIFAKRQKITNCVEKAAIAIVEELARSENGEWSKQLPRTLHKIVLFHSARADYSHVFVVAGSKKLKSGFIAGDKQAVAKLLRGMGGDIIDGWNHPKVGGVRMAASQAAQQFSLYGRDPFAFDTIEVKEFPVAFGINQQILDTNLPDQATSFLRELAGPSPSSVLAGTAKPFEKPEEGQPSSRFEL
jgi:hypothetical protein